MIGDDLEKPSDVKLTDQTNVGLDVSTLGSHEVDDGGNEHTTLSGEPDSLAQMEALPDEITAGDDPHFDMPPLETPFRDSLYFELDIPVVDFGPLVGVGGELAADSLSVKDLLADFDADKGERLDLSALLEFVFGSSGNDRGDVVQLQEKVDGTPQGDANGAAGGQSWTDTVPVAGSAPAFDVVKALFTDDSHVNAAHHTG